MTPTRRALNTSTESHLEYQDGDHFLRVDAWGTDSARVRAGRGRLIDLDGALVDVPPASNHHVIAQEDGTVLVNGGLRVEVSSKGLLRFSRVADDVELLAEAPAHVTWPGARLFTAAGDGYYRMEQRFRAYADEQIFGMGQHQHGRLDQKGMVLDLVQRNAEVSIPFVLSSRGYGFLWNLPAVGRAEFAENGTRWVADAARQIDYWVTTGDGPAQILSHYADATGHSPMLPEWAAGFWQSKLRYESPQQLLDVAREYRARGLPLSVIVVDYFHWPHLGDWRFDDQDWPDPKAMVEELAALGVRTMVSVWPSVSPLSENYDHLRRAGLLIATEQGMPSHHLFPDKGFGGRPLGVSFYDATNPQARDFVWQVIKKNYFDLGIRLWWLDGCEPEMYPEQFANLRYNAGPGREVANIYPREHVRGFYEHMLGEGETEVVCLVRSAWAGSQRFGAALWSGDIPTTFKALEVQVRAGLSVALSGIPWWTTDIGGFHGGDPGSPEYRELLIRWFQYAVFCPLLRLHGHREPRVEFGASHSGGDNEIWSFGEEAYAILANQLRLRERLRDYILDAMREASVSGLPPMRPLFVDYPQDQLSWHVEDQFLFGPDLLVAPVVQAGARARQVYLPDGASWTDTATGRDYEGGQSITAPAPLEHIPVFFRVGSVDPGISES
jgi:alpha-D-xyloside xylohydrolase